MEPQPAEGEARFSQAPTVSATSGVSGDDGEARGHLAIHEHELLRRIGRGAYGEVWLARNALGAGRAVKVVYRKDFDDSRPFEREFRGIQKFEPISRSHEGLVNILQVGRHEDYFYYVMELADDAQESPNDECRNPKEIRNPNVEKATRCVPVQSSNLGNPSTFDIRHSSFYRPLTLREELRTHGRLSAERCVEIGLALTSALAHLHKHGLIHRDIKPSNIILVGGKPKLADIGLVTEVGDSKSIVGTEGYLPPEGPGTPQADIFSLGKVLYEISTGQDRRQFPDLPPAVKEWPDREAVLELNEVVLKACAKDPALRYQSAEEMHTELVLLQGGKSVKRRRALQQLRATSLKAVLGAMALVTVMAGILFLRRLPETYAHSSIPEVNDLVEQGMFCVRSLTADRLHQADLDFQKAVQLDPTYVPAHWGLFLLAIYREEYAWNAPTERRQHIRSLAARLNQIAPSTAESRVASSFIKWMDWKFGEALAEASEATRMRAASKEGRAATHNLYGYYLCNTGQPEKALVEYQTAERLYPSIPAAHHHLGHPYFVWRKFDEALKYYQEALDLEPRHFLGHYFKGRVYEEKGEFAKAIQEFEKCDLLRSGDKAKTERFYQALAEAFEQGGAQGYWKKRLELALKASPQDLYEIATFHVRLGNTNQAYAWLRKACEKKAFNEGPLFDLCWDHNDPQFQAIVRSIGLLQ